MLTGFEPDGSFERGLIKGVLYRGGKIKDKSKPTAADKAAAAES